LLGQTLVLLFCLTIILAVIFGLGFPQTGNYAVYIPFMIGGMLFFNFLDVKIQFRRSSPWVLLITFFLSAVALPLFAYYILSVGFTEPYRIGLLLVACAPTGITTLVLGRYIKGSNYHLVLSNFLFTTFGSMFYIPVLLKFVLNEAVKFDSSLYTLLGQMALLVVLPYILSQTTVHLFHQQLLIRHKIISQGFTLLLLFCIIVVSIGKVADQLAWHVDSMWLAISILAIYLVHGGLGYAIGSVSGNAELKMTLPFICSSRNIQLVFAIAVLNFSPLTYLPIIMGLFFHHLTNAFWLWILGKSQPPDCAA
jgi:predicted Na+-dependent transporter